MKTMDDAATLATMHSILIQLDTDPLASTFDRVVAVDSGVEQLFSYAGVTPENVTPLVHGAIFTRGLQDLKNTAIFIGGSDVEAGEKLLKAVNKAFFGPMRVSVMIDSNGSNTTAAAAVLAAGRHIDLSNARAVVLGGTGPVGFRAAQLLVREGSAVVLTSRTIEKARQACDRIPDGEGRVKPGVSAGPELMRALGDANLIIAAGAAGVQFLDEAQWTGLSSLKVAIDVNAVPPLGLAGIKANDKAVTKGHITCYGALGVGGTKMKIHKAAIKKLFEGNDQVLDTQSIYEIGKALA
jgi:hypothetical protein